MLAPARVHFHCVTSCNFGGGGEGKKWIGGMYSGSRLWLNVNQAQARRMFEQATGGPDPYE